MSRTMSQTARQAIFDQETDSAFLILLEIDHNDLNTPIRVTSDGVDTTHNSNNYVTFPFEVSLPKSGGEEISKVQLTIDNVDRQIVDTIREISTAPDVTMKVVLADSPDTVEAGPFEFKLTDVKYNDKVVQGTLEFTDYLNMAYPKDRFTPANFNAL